jgi:hypothetical protein
MPALISALLSLNMRKVLNLECVYLKSKLGMIWVMISGFANMVARVKRCLRENWGAPFIVGFILLLIVAAGSLSIGVTALANEMVIYAYCALVVGFVLQLFHFMGVSQKKVERIMDQVELSSENLIEVPGSPFPSKEFPKLRKSSCQMISIVTPTYNERENIRLLIERISQVMSGRKYEIIVIDDDSPDGTEEVAKELSKRYPVKILVRNGKFGLASAVLTGFTHARGNILGVIDADLQHPPEYLLEFVKAIEEGGCDVVVGSRYTNGGGIEGWSKKRLLTSKVAVLLAKPLVKGVKDPMSGFFFLKRSIIEDVRFNPTGYKLGLEILVKGNYRKLKEIPYVFKQRKNGVSKLSKTEILSYLSLLKDLYIYKIARLCP